MSGAVYSPEARAALARLEADPASAQLAARVNEALDLLEADPGDRRVRHHRFRLPPIWAIEVRSDDEDWWILWNWWDTDASGDEHIPNVMRIVRQPE